MRADAIADAVVWHDAENGAYSADLELWRELARSAGGPVLEIGCGTGRVALDLGRQGHHVLGVDIDPVLVAALNERAADADVDVSAEVGDARALEVSGEFSLVVVPMQTIQLLADGDERRAALRVIAGRLAPRALAALAIVDGEPGLDGTYEDLPPLPDVAEVDGWIYSSLPIEARSDGESIHLTRLRQIVAPDGDLTEERAELSLSKLTAASLEDEARKAGLAPAGRLEIRETELHMGSTVVLLEVAP